MEAINAHLAQRAKEGTLDQGRSFDDEWHRFLSGKMVALDREKAQFCYLLCRSLRVTRVVEAGTSFGVSTLYSCGRGARQPSRERRGHWNGIRAEEGGSGAGEL